MRLDATGLALANAVVLARLVWAPEFVIELLAVLYLSRTLTALSGWRDAHLSSLNAGGTSG